MLKTLDISPDEKITKRSEPTNKAKTKTNVVKGLKAYLNGLKNYLTTYQGFKIRFVILKIYIYPDIFWIIICLIQIFNSWTSVIHLSLGTHATEYQNINEKNRMRYFLKNIFWLKHFPVTTNCRSRHSRVFCEKCSENFINFSEEHSQ